MVEKYLLKLIQLVKHINTTDTDIGMDAERALEALPKVHTLYTRKLGGSSFHKNPAVSYSVLFALILQLSEQSRSYDILHTLLYVGSTISNASETPNRDGEVYVT